MQLRLGHKAGRAPCGKPHGPRMRKNLLTVANGTHACDHRRKRLLRFASMDVAASTSGVPVAASADGGIAASCCTAVGRGEHGVAAGGHALAEVIVDT